MSYKIIPLDMISAPNFYSPMAAWTITNPNATTIWFQLAIDDSLGERRYVPASGSVLQVVFQRSDVFSIQNNNQLTQTSRNLTKTATVHANDKSLFSVALTTQDVSGIASGSLKVTLTENSVQNTWIQNWIVVKKLTDPGF